MAPEVYVLGSWALPPRSTVRAVARSTITYHHEGMTALLNDTQVQDALGRLQDWSQEGSALVRTAKLGSFPQAIQAVNRIAEIAEQEDHHPDIDIRWRTLTLSCSTHSEGGITEKDVSMAQEIDGVLDALLDQ